jgi:TldD protein
MTVVLGPGWPGILLHEAVGHGLEGDFNRKGTSAFSGRVGQKVASPLCTVVDDGTLPGRRGSLNLDDEGNTSNCTRLIENGILAGYIQDSLNARLMKSKETGNGRRESFASLVMPRMTNTYMLAGPHDPAEIIASVQRGIYAVSFGGGQVDITSGNFTFSASEAYLIEDGKITRPVKGATLVGNGWPERAGRRGSADAAHRRPHGGRHPGLTCLRFSSRAGWPRRPIPSGPWFPAWTASTPN